MRPMNVINKLNESDNRDEINEFASKLCDLIQEKGLDCMKNGDMIYILDERPEGTASMNVQFYEGGNNVSDYEVNYIGLGGDTVEDITVSPLAKSGWEQENGDPRGTQFEDGHECWAEACPLSNTSPEEVADMIKVSFDAIEIKDESSLNEDTDENDPILDKTIKVYDINAFIDKEINADSEEKYQAFDFNNGAAILVKSDGSGCIVDYEAVGSSFDSTSDEVTVYICPKEVEKDGKVAIHVMPSASFKVSVDELLTAPSKDMKVKDFFNKYKYNDRCAANFDNIKPYLTDDKKLTEEKSYVGFEEYGDGEKELFGSLANTHALELIDSLISYYSEMINLYNSDPYAYQAIGDIGTLKEAVSKLEQAKELILSED